MDGFISEELALHCFFQFAKNNPIDVHLTHFCIEMFLTDYPEHFVHKDILKHDTWTSLQRFLLEVNYSTRDLLVMFLYIQRYYRRPKHHRSMKMLPKTLIDCSAFACLHYGTDEILDKIVWEDITGVSWDWVLFFSISFCQDIEYNLGITYAQIWTCYHILININNVETVILSHKTMTECLIQSKTVLIENDENIQQN